LRKKAIVREVVTEHVGHRRYRPASGVEVMYEHQSKSNAQTEWSGKMLLYLSASEEQILYEQAIVWDGDRLGSSIADRADKQSMVVKPKNIDEYLASVSDDKRAALKRLRRIFRTVVPNAEECISYQLPAFRLDGKCFV
jgi:hypothetical protein